MIKYNYINNNISFLNLETKKRILAVQSKNQIIIKLAKNNQPVPVLIKNNHNYPLHSLINPQAEAKRTSQTIQLGPGTLVYALGFGAGYHLADICRNPQISRIIVCEHDPSDLREIMEKIDLSDLLKYKKIEFWFNGDPLEYIQIAPIYENLYTFVTHPVLYQQNKTFFTQLKNNLFTMNQGVFLDFTTQAKMGKIWHKNIFKNISLLKNKSNKKQMLIIPDTLLITGAGPTLLEDLEKIKPYSDRIFTLATDTSIKVLQAVNWNIDSAISIDSQFTSIFHYTNPGKITFPVFFDFTCPAPLIRTLEHPVFYFSNHPILKRLAKNYKENENVTKEKAMAWYPSLNTRSGNVSICALYLAKILQIKTILLAGINFFYTKDKMYEKGTYIEKYFLNKNHYFNTYEQENYEFLIKQNPIKSTDTKYSSPRFQYYRNHLLEFQKNHKDLTIINLSEGQNNYKENILNARENTVRQKFSFKQNFTKALEFIKRQSNLKKENDDIIESLSLSYYYNIKKKLLEKNASHDQYTESFLICKKKCEVEYKKFIENL